MAGRCALGCRISAFQAARPNGNFFQICATMSSPEKLLAHIREYAPDGKVVMEIKTEAPAFAAVRLPNGNIAIANYFGHGRGSHGAGLFEVTREKKVVWQYTDKKSTGGVMGVHIVDGKGPALR